MKRIFREHPNKDLTHRNVVDLRRKFGVREGEKVYAHHYIQDGYHCWFHAAVVDPYLHFRPAYLTTSTALPAGTIAPKEYVDGIERPRNYVGADTLVMGCHSIKAGVQHVINHHHHDRDAPVYFGAFAPEDNMDCFYQYANLNNGQDVGDNHELFAVYQGYFATPRAWFVWHPNGNGRGHPTFRYHPNPNPT